MFQFGTYHPTGFRKMNEHCPHCDHRFEVEPGFFIGAMYVSYAMSVGLMFAVIIGMAVLYPEAEVWVYMAWVIGVNLALYPVFLRYSRVLFAHWFSGVKYDPKREAGGKVPA